VVSGIERNRLLSFVFSLSEEDLSRIEIYGFCDDVGASSYNLTLSQNRANEIKKILLHNDVPEDKITNVDGKGELLLKIVKTTSADRVRALNRCFKKQHYRASFWWELVNNRKFAFFNWLFLFNP
jgi:outer membrane protein OmpA-like peptidoglycan-associated protein